MFTTQEIIIRIVCAIILGSILGIERNLAGKTAGMRTYSMVAMGSSIFVLISQIIQTPNIDFVNPLSLAPAIISGIGFIGAGLIFFQPHEHKVTGLTTAAGLWVSAGVGMASGYGLFDIALISTVAALLVFTVLWFVENKVKRFSYKTGRFEEGNNGNM